MTQLQSRIRRLEAAAGSGEACPACGFRGDYAKLETEVCLEHVPGPDRCPACGRVLVIRIGGSFPKFAGGLA